MAWGKAKGKGRIARFREWLRQRRNGAWAVVVLFLLMGLAWAFVLSTGGETELRAVMCRECAFSELREVDVARIHRVRCAKCKGRVGFVWKCADCDYEYPLVPTPIVPGSMSKKEELARRMREWRCPNCRSYECYQMGNTEFGKRRR